MKVVKSAIGLRIKSLAPAAPPGAPTDCDFLIAELPAIGAPTSNATSSMGRRRNLLQSVSPAVAGRHRCKANARHRSSRGDPILVVKVERNSDHYCRDCALKLIATAHTDLDGLLRSFISGD